MFELIKKTLLTGVGFAVLTKDKVEEMARDLASQANLSEQEGQKFVDELVARSDQAAKDLREQVDRLVGQAMNRVPVVSKAEYDRLAARVAELEAAAFRTSRAETVPPSAADPE